MCERIDKILFPKTPPASPTLHKTPRKKFPKAPTASPIRYQASAPRKKLSYHPTLGIKKSSGASARKKAQKLKQNRDLYELGQLAECNDLSAAKFFFTQGADNGDPLCQYALAKILHQEHNRPIAIDYFKLAAKNGAHQANLDLGKIYLAEKKFEDARFYFETAALNGIAEGYHQLGEMYSGGEKSDPLKAKKYLQKAADRNYAKSEYALGIRLYGEQNFTDAMHYLSGAAKNGIIDACHEIGMMYFEGQGVTQNYHQAFLNFEKAADGGFMESRYYLGLMYLKGLGVAANMDEAVFCFSMAAQKNHPQAIKELFRIGIHFLENKADDTAKQILKITADRGHAPSEYNLSVLFRNQNPADLTEAFKYMRLAANHKLPVAIFWLANYYFHGIGTEVNFAKARSRFREAAQHHWPEAPYFLGFMYEKGLGGELNLEEAKKYYALSVSQGFYFRPLHASDDSSQSATE